MASIVWVPIIFVTASLYLYYLSFNIPSLSTVSASNISVLKFPTSLEDITSLSSLLASYRADHMAYVAFLFCSAYLYKQTFAIPGSVFMNLLAGSLFGVWWGLPIVCSLTAIGATFCFLLSRTFGKEYVIKYFPEKVGALQMKVEENLDSLFFFLLFLRLFPMSPNWFLNITSPILNIPIHLFFFSVLIGLLPYNFICVQTGGMLSQIKSMDDIFNIWTALKMASVAIVSLVPGYLIRRSHRQSAKES